MFVALSQLRIADDRAPELVAAFRARLGKVDAADGFIDIQVWQSDRSPGELTMVSRWRDRDAFKAYMKSADHRESHARIEPGLDGAITLERFDQLHTFEVVAE